MPLYVLDVGLRSELAQNPKKWGFEIHNSSHLNMDEWRYYSIARSYIPGIITYIKNALTRNEVDYLYKEYSRRGLLLGISANAQKFNILGPYMPFSVRSKLKSLMIKHLYYI
jgi:hypothetical protein